MTRTTDRVNDLAKLAYNNGWRITYCNRKLPESGLMTLWSPDVPIGEDAKVLIAHPLVGEERRLRETVYGKHEAVAIDQGVTLRRYKPGKNAQPEDWLDWRHYEIIRRGSYQTFCIVLQDGRLKGKPIDGRAGNVPLKQIEGVCSRRVAATVAEVPLVRVLNEAEENQRRMVGAHRDAAEELTHAFAKLQLANEEVNKARMALRMKVTVNDAQ